MNDAPSDAGTDRLGALFRAARLHPPDERAAFLDAACDDPALRAEVESLLAADAEADDGGFLDRAATALLGDLPPAPEADPLVGQQVGPYRVLRPLGHGGMGAVYLAVREEPFLRHVALKVIRAGLGSPEALGRFEQERQILAGLDHPGIARLLDGGVTGPMPGAPEGLPYFALEYVEGRPLTAFCDEHRLGVDARLALFAQVCDAVHRAHQNLVLHRDLKPSNVLVTASGGPDGGPAVKLLDFGIAKLLNPNLSPAAMPVTRTDLRVLTPEYASPEQVRGEPLSTASDVYSLGVVLYELLSGHRPYRLTRGSADEIVRAIVETDPERPSTVAARPTTRPDGTAVTAAEVGAARAVTPERLRRALRGDLDAIVMKALRKEPPRRYASAEALAQDLDRYRRGLPVHAHRDSRGYRLRKMVQRHRGAVASGALALVALVGGLGVALWQASVARSEQAVAEAALAESEEVRSFLIDLFRAADPVQNTSVATTTGDLLAQGIARAETLDDQPVVQAEVFDAVGQVYVGLGEYARAQPLFERTLALRRAALGPGTAAEADALLHLGDAHRGQAHFAEAEALYRDALALQRSIAPGSPAVAESLERLGSIRTYQGDLVGAEAHYRDALDLRLAAGSADSPEAVEGMRFLAVTLRRRGDYDGALGLYQDVLDAHRRRPDAETSALAGAMLHLGDQYALMGRDAEAEPLFEEGLRLQREAYPGGHPRLAHGLNSLAELYDQTGRTGAAEALFRESVDLARRVYGEDSWRVGPTLLRLGRHLRRRGRLPEAERLFEEALVTFRSAFEPTHRWVLTARVELALTDRERGRLRDAEAALRETVATRERTEGSTNVITVITRTWLADVLAERGRSAEAERQYLQALDALQPAVADPQVDLQTILRGLVSLYDAQGRTDEADRYRPRLTATGGA